MTAPVKLTPMLWFERDAEVAAAHYIKGFADGKILHILRHGDEALGPNGTPWMVTIQLGGVQFELLNAGPMYKPTEANSYVIYCEDQAEVDRLWAHFSEGGSTQACGWVKDRWGFSWQITPRIMMEVMSGTDDAARARAIAAMLEMEKFDVGRIEAAVRG